MTPADKRTAFAEAIHAGYSGKDAATAAGYSAATAATAATRLLKHSHVKTELARMRAESARDEFPRDPLKFLIAVMNCPRIAPRVRVRAAIAAAPYVHSQPTS
jgi:phage terminase small subunit